MSNEEQENKSGKGCGAALAIIAVVIAALWILMGLFDWIDITVMEGGSVGSLPCLVVAVICAVIVGICACLFWKKSATIRETVTVIFYIVVVPCVLLLGTSIGGFLLLLVVLLIGGLLWAGLTIPRTKTMRVIIVTGVMGVVGTMIALVVVLFIV